MENWTLGSINGFLVFIVTFAGTLTAVGLLIRRVINLIFKPVNDKLATLGKDINDKLDSLDGKMDKVDKNATMNYLVRCMEDLDKDESLEGVARQRFIEQYDHYIKPKSEGGLGGNSYIREEYDRLKKAGKI